MLNAVWGGTGALMLEGDGLVENNLVAGGGYTIYVKDDLAVVGNHVSTVFRHDGPNAGQPIEAP